MLTNNVDPSNKKINPLTLKNRANKCTSCWGKKKVTFTKATRYPVFFMFIDTATGRKVYNVNSQLITCSCQH